MVMDSHIGVTAFINSVFCHSIMKCKECLPNFGIYKCNDPLFASCVAIRGGPVMREIQLFRCDVKIVGWTGPCIRLTQLFYFVTGATTSVQVSTQAVI